MSAEIAMPVSSDARPGARILFDDGKIATRATHVNPPEMVAEVEVGGRLTDHKGMNLPGTPLSIPCITEKDFEDLKFGIEQGVDAVALSFVRSASDIETLRERIRKITNDPPILISKIEREEAVEVIGLRRRIAQKMQESKRRIPHYSYVEEVDVTELEALRARLNQRFGETRGKLTLLPLLLRAIVLAVRDHPQVNARFDDDAGVVDGGGEQVRVPGHRPEVAHAVLAIPYE